VKITSKILLPHVYSLNFDTRYDLCMSFVRIQEFYESPKFRGKYFTLEQYIDYWCKDFGKGSFTYPSVWGGFNVPGKVLNNWINKFQRRNNDVRDKENKIFEKICVLMRKEGVTDYKKIYVIGTHSENKACADEITINHELAHAMYSLYPKYKKSCKELINGLTKEQYEKFKDKLIKMGYCNEVVDDELQAYFSTGLIGEGDDLFSGKPEFISNFQSFKNNLK